MTSVLNSGAATTSGRPARWARSTTGSNSRTVSTGSPHSATTGSDATAQPLAASVMKRSSGMPALMVAAASTDVLRSARC